MTDEDRKKRDRRHERRGVRGVPGRFESPLCVAAHFGRSNVVSYRTLSGRAVRVINDRSGAAREQMLIEDFLFQEHSLVQDHHHNLLSPFLDIILALLLIPLVGRGLTASQGGLRAGDRPPWSRPPARRRPPSSPATQAHDDERLDGH
ncbi:hypothetical protein Aduo_010214 [Ancylostoma duodenale]